MKIIYSTLAAVALFAPTLAHAQNMQWCVIDARTNAQMGCYMTLQHCQMAARQNQVCIAVQR